MKDTTEVLGATTSASVGAFANRHIGPSLREVEEMLATIGVNSVDELIREALPGSIRLQRPLRLGPALSEAEAIAHLRSLAEKNEVYTSLIGMGYHGPVLPPVIQRNILETPPGTRLTRRISPR